VQREFRSKSWHVHFRFLAVERWQYVSMPSIVITQQSWRTM
jgi:hypothetical protein